jgi:predicted metallo-beta-lactamase superfamily hydrolase
MPTAHLKTGEVVQVSLDNLEQFIEENRENIVVRHVKRRGKLRKKFEESQNATA